MPNGRIFLILAVLTFDQYGEKLNYFEIKEVNKKSWTLESRYVSKSLTFLNGAVTSTINNMIYVTGSKTGRSKSAVAIQVSRQQEQTTVKGLPEILFGRYDHSMTVLDMRYLYIFGGHLT